MTKKLKLSNIKISDLNPNDFIFLMTNWDDLKSIPIETVGKIMNKFEEKLPSDVGCAILPNVGSIWKSNEQEMIKLFLNIAINNYNAHFNDIYLPYTE